MSNSCSCIAVLADAKVGGTLQDISNSFLDPLGQLLSIEENFSLHLHRPAADSQNQESVVKQRLHLWQASKQPTALQQ